MKVENRIAVIDIFAGPGGLGEGFMSVKKDDKSVFDIKLSIEKDEHAHRTLMWRSFYRQFAKEGREIPNVYYDAISEKNLKKREQIIETILDKWPEGKHACHEAQLVELGGKEWSVNKVDNLISDRLGENPGDWVLIGGPPCQAYSLVGRSRVGGIDPQDHRVYLYKQYLRIIKKHKPAVFVMENVKGLLSAKVNGERIFLSLKKDLEQGGKYIVYSLVKEVKDDNDYVIHAEDYGVPQKRHRVILLGVRKDIGREPIHLGKFGDNINVRSVIGRLPKLRSGLNRSYRTFEIVNKNGKEKKRRLYDKVVDSKLEWEKLIETYKSKIRIWDDLLLNGLANDIKAPARGIGSEFVKYGETISKDHPLYDWYIDGKLDGVANHESRAHLTQDLMRYLYASVYVNKNKTFPRLSDYAVHGKDLLPDHENVESGKFTDRFRVQLPNEAATTVTSHISKDGHYFIHYDPKQCRSLTVREAARIQTFPDNFLFRGSRTQQYHQVGNAVPPFLAKQIANIVHDLLNH